MNLRMLLFPLILLSFLFGTHFFIYYSTISFFSIERQGLKNILLALFGILSLSFIIAALIARFNDAFFSRMIYFLSAFWLGVAINLILAFILAWMIVLVSGSIGTGLKMAIGSLAFAAALAFSLYGLWNALNPVIKDIEVEISGLNEDWKGRKIIQISDTHLGRINRVSFAEKLVEKVNKEEPDLILITGDLFDGMGSDPASFMDALNKLKASKGVYFVTGNHEIYLGVERVLEVLKESNIRVLDNEVADIGGLQLAGVSYPDFNGDGGKAVPKLEGYDPEIPGILLYHTPSGIADGNGNGINTRSDIYWSPDINFSRAKKMGIDLQLSGHSHGGQIFPFNLVTRMIYSGYDYGLNASGSLQVYTTSGAGTWGPPMRTGSKSEIVSIRLK